MTLTEHAKKRMVERSDENGLITVRHIDAIKKLSVPEDARDGNFRYQTINLGIIFDPDKNACVTFYRV